MKKNSIIVTALGTVATGLTFLLLMPFIVPNFGIDRFGYISLMLVSLSVSSIFDAGISRGLTHAISGHPERLHYIWPVVAIVTLWGAAVGSIGYYLFKFYLNFSEGITTELRSELNDSAIYVALTMPLAIVHAAFRGVVEGKGLFYISSSIKFFAGLVFAFFILMGTYFEFTLEYVAISLFLSRLVTLLVLITVVQYRVKLRGFFWDWVSIRNVLVFGGWASISTIGSSLSIYIDRFVAGVFISPVVYGVYSAVSDVVMRFLFIPGAVGTVLFPYVSGNNKNGDDAVARALVTAYLIVAIGIGAVVLLLYFFGIYAVSFFSKEIVDIELAALVLKYTLAGLLVSSMCQIPYAVLQGLGYVRFTARLHTLELAIFTPVLFYLCKFYGVEGLLAGWLVRIIFDFVVLTVWQGVLLRQTRLQRSKV